MLKEFLPQAQFNKCTLRVLITYGVLLTCLFSYTILLSYPDHLDLDSILEKSPDLGCHFLPGLAHRPQSLQLFKCGVCLQETGKCVRACVCVWVVGVSRLEGQEIIIKNKHAHTTILTKAYVRLYKIQNTCKYKHLVHMYRRHNMVKASDAYTCICVHNIQKLKYTHCHSSPNLLLHTIPTLYSLWKQALQRQHTHSHTKISRRPVQITSNCATNAPCAKSSNIYCTLIIETLDVCEYSALCGKYQRLAISVFSHVQWGMKALKSTPN